MPLATAYSQWILIQTSQKRGFSVVLGLNTPKGPVTHALESSVYAEARSQERKMAWQRRKA